MKNLFRRHQKADETGAPPEGTPEKRSYVFLLEFRCRGRLVVSARTDSMGRVLRIGRAPENDWVIPPQDRVSADYEAELRLGNREIRLQACGKNGFHVRGKTLTSYVLKGNDRIAIGDCELFVKPAEISDSRPCDVHRLEFRNGPREGELVRLEKKLVRIGSAPENDIVIRDDVVSRFHAEIRIAENGESWIRDLDSVNGTFVNGARLGRQERMLMDSDEISIAFFDLIFLDPPYDTGLLEQALQDIAGFDICREHGIIMAESPADAVLPPLEAPYRLYREYRYGRIKLTVYHRQGNEE